MSDGTAYRFDLREVENGSELAYHQEDGSVAIIEGAMRVIVLATETGIPHISPDRVAEAAARFEAYIRLGGPSAGPVPLEYVQRMAGLRIPDLEPLDTKQFTQKMAEIAGARRASAQPEPAQRGLGKNGLKRPQREERG